MKTTWAIAQHWNQDVTPREIEAYCWTTWEGCGGRADCAASYAQVCVQECGFKALDNIHGFGYSGATWPTIITTLRRQGMIRPEGGWRDWTRRHPYMVNKHLAAHFCGFVEREGRDEAIRTWHRGATWRTNPKDKIQAEEYLKKVCRIADYWDGKSPCSKEE